MQRPSWCDVEELASKTNDTHLPWPVGSAAGRPFARKVGGRVAHCALSIIHLATAVPLRRSVSSPKHYRAGFDARWIDPTWT